MKKYLFTMLLPALFFVGFGCCKTAKAEVCFLPEGCGEEVPFNEYKNDDDKKKGGDEGCVGNDCQAPEPKSVEEEQCPKNCFADEKEARIGRTALLDSYAKSGACYCLKSSCSGSNSGIGHELMGKGFSSGKSYTLDSPKKGEGWSCSSCKDKNSLYGGKYSCTCTLTAKAGYTLDTTDCTYTATQCPEGATIEPCTATKDGCVKCTETGQYSEGKKCIIKETVDAYCPEGYSYEKPTAGCWNEKTENCGEGKKCYQSYDKKCDGDHKILVGSGTACDCSCEEGYTLENGACVSICEGSRTYDKSSKTCKCPSTAPYTDEEQCLAGWAQSADNLNWWQMFQQKANTVAQCLTPIKTANAGPIGNWLNTDDMPDAVVDDIEIQPSVDDEIISGGKIDKDGPLNPINIDEDDNSTHGSKKCLSNDGGNCWYRVIECDDGYKLEGGECIPVCPGSKTYDKVSKTCKCPSTAPYTSKDLCLASWKQSANTLNWWQMFQQKANNVAQCLNPIRTANAVNLSTDAVPDHVKVDDPVIPAVVDDNIKVDINDRRPFNPIDGGDDNTTGDCKSDDGGHCWYRVESEPQKPTCDARKLQFDTQSACESTLQPEDGCSKEASSGCYIPACDAGSYNYSTESDCEHYTHSECIFDDHYYCYTPNCGAETGFGYKAQCEKKYSDCKQDPSNGCWDGHTAVSGGTGSGSSCSLPKISDGKGGCKLGYEELFDNEGCLYGIKSNYTYKVAIRGTIYQNILNEQHGCERQTSEEYSSFDTKLDPGATLRFNTGGCSFTAPLGSYGCSDCSCFDQTYTLEQVDVAPAK